jgi:glycosyltransferase involved in cell wall biosynthesis
MGILSILIPAYNEEKTILQLLEKVVQVKLPDNYRKEIRFIRQMRIFFHA